MSDLLSGMPRPTQGAVDDLDAYLDDAMRDPAFRAALEDAEAKHRLLDTLVGLRREQGLTQKQVAGRMGVRQPTISGFETEDADPRLGTLQRYARAVGGRLRITVTTQAYCDWLAPTSTAYEEGTSTLAGPSVERKDTARKWSGRPEWLQTA